MNTNIGKSSTGTIVSTAGDMVHEEVPNLPVSWQNLVECEFSARFWAGEIGFFAHEMRNYAKYYAIAAALLTALAGLGVWSTLVASTAWPAVLLVSLVSLISTALVVIPQNMKYGECAGAAKSLSSRYGHVLGELEDALAMFPEGTSASDNPLVRRAVEDFEKVREAKEALDPYPAKLAEKIKALREQNKHD